MRQGEALTRSIRQRAATRLRAQLCIFRTPLEWVVCVCSSKLGSGVQPHIVNAQIHCDQLLAIFLAGLHGNIGMSKKSVRLFQANPLRELWHRRFC